MSTPLWALELAEHFWHDAGTTAPFPRNLRAPIALQLPVTVVLQPQLHSRHIEEWLQWRGIHCEMHVTPRPLCACLVARSGHGVIFLDSTDGEDQQRFSLAHELAHFLRHYRLPRAAAAARLGAQVLEVLDGVRPPRHEERAHALLTNVQLGYHLHLMERDAGRVTSEAADLAEREADILAFELLAPAAAIREAVGQTQQSERYTRAVTVLIERFGLPPAAAQRYGAQLFPQRDAGPPTLLQRLRSAR